MKDQPAAGYAARMEMARTKGRVRPDKGRFMIDSWADGPHHKLWHLPAAGSRFATRILRTKC